MTRGPDTPAFEGSLLTDGGRVVGCRLVDRFGMLRPDRARTSPVSMLWDVRRRPGVIVALLTKRLDGDMPRGRQRPNSGFDASGETTKDVTVQDWLWRMETSRSIAGLPTRPVTVDGSAMANYLVLPSVPPSGETSEDLEARAKVDLARALDVIAPFVATMDPRAVDLALSGRMPMADRRIYPLSDRTCHPDGHVVKALDAEPELMGTVLRVFVRHPADLKKAVETGPASIRRLVVTNLDTDAHPNTDLALRLACKLAQLPPRERAKVQRAFFWHVEGNDDACGIARMVRGLPLDWIPRDLDGWLGLAACGWAVEAAQGWAGSRAAAMLDAKDDWPRFVVRLRAAYGGDGTHGPHDLGRALADMRDVHPAYASEVLGPALVLAGLEPVEAAERAGMASPRLLHDGCRLCAMLGASRRWHRARHRILEVVRRFPTPDAIRGWPRAWPDATLHGVDVSELVDVDALRDEGADGPDAEGRRGLGHCVGGYAERCLDGHGRVLSLRRAADGVRSSTAEVAWRDGHVIVLQHRGRRNAAPPKEAVAALSAYVAAADSGDLAPDPEALAPVRGRRRKGPSAPYDHSAPGAWEAVRTAWDPFVPRRLRGASPEVLAGLVRASTADGCDGKWRPEPVLPSSRGG